MAAVSERAAWLWGAGASLRRMAMACQQMGEEAFNRTWQTGEARFDELFSEAGAQGQPTPLGQAITEILNSFQ